MVGAKKKGKVVVAMSGGVDSSVTAFLLKKQGYEVTGFFMRLIPGQEKSERAVRAVCTKLGIKFYPINLSRKFEKEIIKYFLDSYKAGLTPNPCVKCNSVIKFGELLHISRKLGADYFATGHYVNRKQKAESRKQNNYRLFRGRDESKDQSYFLYNLNQEILAHVLFPLGDYVKDEVRRIADRKRLPYLISESQDVCFLNRDGKILEHNEYLKKHIKLKPGKIKVLLPLAKGEIERGSKVIGEHQGLPLYTIGQRRGIEIGGTGPYYAARADYKNNILYVVSYHDDPALFSDVLMTGDVNWISGEEPKLPLKCQAVIRYRHKAVECEVYRKQKTENRKQKIIVKFSKPQRAITPGQSVVFYKKQEVLGGGIIQA